MQFRHLFRIFFFRKYIIVFSALVLQTCMTFFLNSTHFYIRHNEKYSIGWSLWFYCSFRWLKKKEFCSDFTRQYWKWNWLHWMAFFSISSKKKFVINCFNVYWFWVVNFCDMYVEKINSFIHIWMCACVFEKKN